MTAPPSRAGVVVRALPLDDPIAQELVGELLTDLTERYGEEDAAPHPTPDELGPPDGVFLVAFLDGAPAGCGGLRRHSDSAAEIKRMYVRRGARGRGVARALLDGLEATARAAGYREVRLETGTAQPEAMALYASSGYARIPGYGFYADYPSSRCYAKDLDADSSRSALSWQTARSQSSSKPRRT